MKKSIHFQSLLVVFVALAPLPSCTNIDDRPKVLPNAQEQVPSTGKEGNDVRYLISGDYSGTLDLSVVLHNNMPIHPITVNALPWEQTFKAPDTSSFIGGWINAFHNNGMPGQEVNFKMFFKDRLVESVTRSANGEGNVNLPMETLHFDTYDPDGTIDPGHIGKTVRYEAEPNFDHPFNVRYRVADGSWENITLTNFPWSYSYGTEAHSTEATLYTYELVANELDGIMAVNDSIVYRLYINDVETQSAILHKIGPEAFRSEGQIHYEFD